MDAQLLVLVRRWAHKSVQLLACSDPINEMISRAQSLALRAMEEGWQGPPYDPFALADHLKIPVVPREDVADARTAPLKGGGIRIEYNPMRPRLSGSGNGVAYDRNAKCIEVENLNETEPFAATSSRCRKEIFGCCKLSRLARTSAAEWGHDCSVSTLWLLASDLRSGLPKGLKSCPLGNRFLSAERGLGQSRHAATPRPERMKRPRAASTVLSESGAA
jgi:hypothetical protein